MLVLFTITTRDFDMPNIIQDKGLQEFVRNMIMTNTVSTNSDETGNMRSYIIRDIASDAILILDALPLISNDMKPFVNYSITLNDIEIADFYIPVGRTMYSPDEELVIRLFAMCSSKLIMQEATFQMQMMIGRKNNNHHIN